MPSWQRQYDRDSHFVTQFLLGWKTLDEKIVKDGESWERLRRAFSVLASSFIGGQSVSRDFKGSEQGHDPVTPIPGEKQREALDFLATTILAGDAFHFSGSVNAALRRVKNLGLNVAEARTHHGFDYLISRLD